ncbi:MAG: glycyl-radical enzyme activating protein [Oscillospiraceae bacterium]|nr:glycyl-radical enzyme activating protein [Oscillospiraceae bacterium]
MHISAPVFNIQSYSIHDGPGIRTTVFLKGCPLRCKWCANPESHSVKSQLMTYVNKCTLCRRCIMACPTGAINAKVETDRALCTACGKCVEVCPRSAREIAGKTMSTEEVLERVLEDRLFIENGGGMTVSGGEPLMHPDFTEELLRAAKGEGLHTAIETCCYAKREDIDRVFRWVDYAMVDIKHMDPSEHMRLTGVSNETILENIMYICNELKVPMMVSIPVIPAHNDSAENLKATAQFIVSKLGQDVPVRLLPYHRMGEGKNESLGNGMDMSIAVPDDEQMMKHKAIFDSAALKVQIGG